MEKESKLIIVPQGGLANRMRAIASALVYAEKFSRPLTVAWHSNKDLNISFSELFKTKNVPFELMELSPLKYHLYYEAPRKKNLLASKFTARLKGNRIIDIKDYVDEEYVADQINKTKGDLIVNSGLQFADFENDFFNSIFTFSERVGETKKRILNGSRPQYALHIRRTDNAESIKNSPVELFENIVAEKISVNPDTLFFLATDDNRVKSYFANKFTGNVVFNPNKASRDTSLGMLEAAAEFCILSECKTIYGSFWSSFSDMAAVYGNSQLTVVKN